MADVSYGYSNDPDLPPVELPSLDDIKQGRAPLRIQMGTPPPQPPPEQAPVPPPPPRPITLTPVDHQPDFVDQPRPMPPPNLPPQMPLNNMQAAHDALNLSPQEQALYARHLSNLYGPGGVDNPDGSRSSLYMSVQQGPNGRFYNVPTVWNGKTETEKYVRPEDGKVFDVPNATARTNIDAAGIDSFPSYATADEAVQRYKDMHDFMERDTSQYQLPIQWAKMPQQPPPEQPYRPVKFEPPQAPPEPQTGPSEFYERTLKPMGEAPQRVLGWSAQELPKAIDAAYENLVASGGQVQQGYGQILSNQPASGLGNVAMGVMGAAASPFTAFGHATGEATKEMTGSPEIGERAEAVSTLATPGGWWKMMQALKPEQAMFIGAGARAFPHEKVPVAEQMEGQGRTTGEIWNTTGLVRQPDGQWRAAVPDYGSQLSQNFPSPREGYQVNTTLGQVLDHPLLYHSYPDMPDIPLRVVNDPAGSYRAGYDGPQKGFTVNVARLEPGESTKSSLLHEVQHHVQEVEGWSPGGSPELPIIQKAVDARFGPNYREGLINQLYDVTNTRDGWIAQQFRNRMGPQISDAAYERMAKDNSNPYVQQLRDEYWRTAPDENAKLVGIERNLNEYNDFRIDEYKRLLGEVESRNTQTRMDMPPDVLARTEPLSTEDLPKGVQKNVLPNVDEYGLRGGSTRIAPEVRPQSRYETAPAGIGHNRPPPHLAGLMPFLQDQQVSR
jgi:hypothetical protein